MPGGKYALIEVPDFSGGMSSYLRLGAAAPLGESAGDDLAARIQSFDDDERKREPGAPSVAERKAETAKLHTKGGWRDHSDGNRVTTTRGDKIEIIQGNYRMLVLGRGEHDSGWDISGGHVSEVGETFAGGSTIEWVEDYGGTWKVVETVVKGEVNSTYHGDVIDVYLGKRKVSTIGREVLSTLSAKDDSLDDSKPDHVNQVPMQNPTIVEKTWAKSISSYTGSAALPVPSILEVTWAETMSTETHARSMKDETFAESMESTTKVKGRITSRTTAGSMEDTTTVSGTIESETRANKVVSTTRADTEDRTYGNTRSYQEGDTFAEVRGIETTINVGLVNEVVLGALTDTTVGANASVTLGASASVEVGAVAEISLSARLEMSAGPRIEIGPEGVRLVGDTTSVALTRKVLSAMNLYF